MYKVIMRLTTINSVASTQMLRDNLQHLSLFAETVSGNINKINTEFNKTTHRFWLEGQQSTTPSTSYSMPTWSFPATTSRPMKQKHNGYLDGSLTLTHEALMAYAKAHFNYLKNRGQWGAKSPDDKKIVVMAAEINAPKGQLKLDPKLSTIAKDKKK
jgi:hypothetical protein